MKEHKGAVTFMGSPLTLLGNIVEVGKRSPDVELIDNDLKPFRLSSLLGKVCVVLSVPSLDTPVCDVETRRFNKEAENLGSDVHVLTVSMDLPFAQKRWCGSAGIEMVKTLSDHRNAEFGEKWGLLIKELRLLARSVVLLDREGIVRYVELVKEIADQPDYDLLLKEVKKLF